MSVSSSEGFSVTIIDGEGDERHATVYDQAGLVSLFSNLGVEHVAQLTVRLRPAEPAIPQASAPSWTIGHAQQRSVTTKLDAPTSAPAPTTSLPDPDQGWRRPLTELGATLQPGKRVALPEAIEQHAPSVNILHSAGEQAVFALEDGRTYTCFGWPDLRRPSSKVIAIANGEPLAEVIVLHRFPVQTGLCIDGSDGMLLSSSEDVSETCEAITGRCPEDTTGRIFGVQGDTVWIVKDNQVFSWDGRQLRMAGNPKQVLASCLLQWSSR